MRVSAIQGPRGNRALQVDPVPILTFTGPLPSSRIHLRIPLRLRITTAPQSLGCRREPNASLDACHHKGVQGESPGSGRAGDDRGIGTFNLQYKPVRQTGQLQSSLCSQAARINSAGPRMSSQSLEIQVVRGEDIDRARTEPDDRLVGLQ